MLVHSTGTILLLIILLQNRLDPTRGPSRQRPRCNTCSNISTVAEIRGPWCFFSIHDHFTCQSENLVGTAYLAADVLFFTLVIVDETSGVISANIWEVHATTLGFLWPPQATVFLMSRCVVCVSMQWKLRLPNARTLVCTFKQDVSQFPTSTPVWLRNVRKGAARLRLFS